MSQDAPAYAHILYEERGAVAVISFNRPQSRNAWHVALLRETIDAVRRANAADGVGAIVLTGEGPVYCAGTDIKSPPEPKDESGRRPTVPSHIMGEGDHNWITLMSGSKPVIVAVNGPAVGLGVTHILAADIRLAAESATFSFPFLRVGAMPECGATATLARLVGFGRAMDIILRTAKLTAAEALQIGLVTAVHPDAELRAAAIALAEQIAALPPLQVRLTKGMMWDNAWQLDPAAIMRRESDAFMEMFHTLKRTRGVEGSREPA